MNAADKHIAIVWKLFIELPIKLGLTHYFTMAILQFPFYWNPALLVMFTVLGIIWYVQDFKVYMDIIKMYLHWF